MLKAVYNLINKIFKFGKEEEDDIINEIPHQNPRDYRKGIITNIIALDGETKSKKILKTGEISVIEGGFEFNSQNIDFNPMEADFIILKCIKNEILKREFRKDVSVSTVIQHENGFTIVNVKRRDEIILIPEIPFFILQYGQCKKIVIEVTNTGYKRKINEFILISHSVDLIRKPNEDIIWNKILYTINCRAHKLGSNRAVLKWTFGNFQITRSFKYNVELNETVIPAIEKLWFTKFFDVKLEPYLLPHEIINICSQDSTTAIVSLINLHPYLRDKLTINYIDKMHMLLFIEEAQCVLNTKLLTNNFRLFLSDENIVLNYKNDSAYSHLCVGDTVVISKPCEEYKFQGKIFDIISNQIFMEVNYLFMQNFESGALYKVEFVQNRTPMRKRHMAVDIVRKYDLLDRVLPLKTIIEPSYSSVDKYYNEDLNEEQKNAVNNVLNQKTSHPYVIFGPPGTGKTKTVVEIILQLFKKDSKIMVVAPTNSAIDLIGVQLYEYGIEDMVRLCSYSAFKQGNVSVCMTHMTFVPSSFDAPFINDAPIITKNRLGTHKITLGTMQCISAMRSVDFPSGYFTHIIIDEAGQLTEPEALIPISFLNNNSQLILAGDPNQLGPVIVSQLAQELGLKDSFLARIMKLKSYNNYDKRIATKLIRNYRALPKLVETISDIFYEKDLVSMLNDKSREALLLKTIKINNKIINKSMICINVEGAEEQTEESSSYFNKCEVAKIFLLLHELYTVISPDQIGIIAPYSSQIKMIYKMLESVKALSPKIGSVEEFQGEERDVIIFSTVRSSRDLNQGLPKLITERNKINVALSRAKVMNIIIGNKNYLQSDTLWQSILNHCE